MLDIQDDLHVKHINKNRLDNLTHKALVPWSSFFQIYDFATATQLFRVIILKSKDPNLWVLINF